jgi:hypothetical protein
MTPRAFRLTVMAAINAAPTLHTEVSNLSETPLIVERSKPTRFRLQPLSLLSQIPSHPPKSQIAQLGGVKRNEDIL